MSGTEPFDPTDPRNDPDLVEAAVVDLGAERARRAREESDTHLDVALDEQPAPGGALVDPPPGRTGNRQPIVPVGLSTWGAIKSTLRYGLGVGWYHSRFHALRSPWYAVQALFWSVVGVFRLIGRQLTWWWVTEQTGLRQKAADEQDWQAWLKLHREVKATRAWRFFVLLCELLMLVFLAPALYVLAPAWAVALVAVVGVVGLARLGRPADRPVPADQPGHRATRLPRGRAGAPGQAQPADPVRRPYEPRRVGYRLSGGHRCAVRQDVGGRTQGQGCHCVRAGRVGQPGVPDQGPDQPPAAPAVRGRP